MKRNSTVLGTALLLGFGQLAQAGYIVDTGTPSPSEGNTPSTFRAGQFTVTETVTITGVGNWTQVVADGEVDFSIRANGSCSNTNGSFACPVGDFAGALPGGELYTGTVNAKAGAAAEWIMLTGLQWTLAPGTYWLLRGSLPVPSTQIFAAPFSNCFDGSAACGGFDGVDAEASWAFAANSWAPNGARIGWRIEGAAAQAVPEPATLALFGLGLAGLAIGRRRARAAS